MTDLAKTLLGWRLLGTSMCHPWAGQTGQKELLAGALSIVCHQACIRSSSQSSHMQEKQAMQNTFFK